MPTLAGSPYAQLLDVARPATLPDVVRLTLLQVDPVAMIAPSANLVAWSRLGSSYAPADLETALADRTLIERPAGGQARRHRRAAPLVERRLTPIPECGAPLNWRRFPGQPR